MSKEKVLSLEEIKRACLEDKIADLEAKLAESKEQLKQSREWFIKCDKERLSEETKKNIAFTNYKETLKENKELKQQLAEKNADLHQIYSHLGVEAFGEDIHEQALKEIAEKEKEIEDMKNNHYLLKKDYIVDYFVSQTNEPMPIPKFVTNQDKISFAVEQLEKFRDIMEKLNENNSGYIIRFSSMRDREKFHEALDNQIEELKKENVNE